MKGYEGECKKDKKSTINSHLQNFLIGERWQAVIRVPENS